MSRIVQGIQTHFKELPEFRKRKVRKHPLIKIIFIALCAMIAGADTFTDMEIWALKNKKWLEDRIDLKDGIPSHDTLGRFFELVNNVSFFKCFLAWVCSITEDTDISIDINDNIEHQEQICIDGKISKASFDTNAGIKALHLVRAWATQTRMVIEQQRVEEKSNEITAIPEILKRLDLQGVLVSIDAMGTHKEIASQIVNQGGDYLLVLKDNHPMLYERAIDNIKDWESKKWKIPFPKTFAKSIDKSKGYTEIRRCWLVESADFIDVDNDWKNLFGIAIVEREKIKKGKSTKTRRYYLTTLKLAKTVLNGSRNHWGIENECHWLLDVLFLEDISRIRQGHAAENMSSLRQICLSLFRAEVSSKLSLRAKRKMAGWDVNYISDVLAAGRLIPESLCD